MFGVEGFEVGSILGGGAGIAGIATLYITRYIARLEVKITALVSALTEQSKWLERIEKRVWDESTD